MTEDQKHELYIHTVEESMACLVDYSRVLDRLYDKAESEGKEMSLDDNQEVKDWAMKTSERIEKATEKLGDGTNPMPKEVIGDPQHMQFTCLGVVIDFLKNYCDTSVVQEAMRMFMPELMSTDQVASNLQQIISKIAQQAGLDAKVDVVPVQVDRKTGEMRRMDTGELCLKKEEEDPFADVPLLDDEEGTVVIDNRKGKKDG